VQEKDPVHLALCRAEDLQSGPDWHLNLNRHKRVLEVRAAHAQAPPPPINGDLLLSRMNAWHGQWCQPTTSNSLSPILGKLQKWYNLDLYASHEYTKGKHILTLLSAASMFVGGAMESYWYHHHHYHQYQYHHHWYHQW
jgi:hypothetical protein